MPRLTFWNVRHLSAGSDDDRKNAIQATLKGCKADLMFFSELTTSSVYPAPQNLTYRKTNDHQLCYGCLNSAWNDVPLTRQIPTSTPDYRQGAFKGGNDFTELADRALGYYGTVNAYGQNIHIYMIHAPAAKGSAKKVMAFLGCYLDSVHGANPWLLVGDFNVEPDELASAKVGIQLQDLILAPDEPTKIGKKRDKTYDYALCNFKTHATIKRVRTSARFHKSDHYPIAIEF